jgi:TetR/AcrR family transcriptional repressor of lmrAB and yxaGH operons
MGTDTRERMVAAATQLFARRGYDATGFRDIVHQAGAARGAIYHHFPEGKTQGREVRR